MKLAVENDWTTDWNWGEGFSINIVWNGVSLFQVGIWPMFNMYQFGLLGFVLKISGDW